MAGRSKKVPKQRPLSPEAAAWEQERLHEAGLTDVVWDAACNCPLCTGKRTLRVESDTADAVEGDREIELLMENVRRWDALELLSQARRGRTRRRR